MEVSENSFLNGIMLLHSLVNLEKVRRQESLFFGIFNLLAIFQDLKVDGVILFVLKSLQKYHGG